MGTSTICSERGRCLRFSCVFLRDVVTLWVKCVFSSLLLVNKGFHWWLFLSDVATQFRVKVVVFIRHPSDRRNFLWLVTALLPGLSLFFDNGLSFPGLICYCAMSLWYVDLLSCGCAPTVCLAMEFVAMFPVLRFPACSGCAGSCGFSSPIWFTTFGWGHPCVVEACVVLDRNEGLVCFSFPYGLILPVGVTFGSRLFSISFSIGT